MATTVVPKVFELIVDFDPNRDPIFRFFGDGSVSSNDGFNLEINSALGIIPIRLKGPEGATFDDIPLKWIDSSGQPIEMPACFTLQQQTPTLLALIDVNITLQVDSFGFEVQVDYRNEIFTSPDPTIINKDILGGDDDFQPTGGRLSDRRQQGLESSLLA